MYFDSISGSELPLFDREIGPSMPGCYTSQVRIKQTHCLLENMLYQTEKLLRPQKSLPVWKGIGNR